MYILSMEATQMNNKPQPELKEIKGHCNCCGRDVVLIHHIELGESVCKICRSHDVRRAAPVPKS